MTNERFHGLVRDQKQKRPCTESGDEKREKTTEKTQRIKQLQQN